MRKVIQRRSEQAWRELVTRQSQSGLSVQAFCRRERLNPWTLYGWRSRLGIRGTSEEPVVSRAAEAEPAAGFIDLGGLAGGCSRCEIRLDLGGGVVLHVVRS
jgi:putative transposase